MFPTASHTIRPARTDDEPALRRLAALDSQRPLAAGPVLVGVVDGEPAAALSLADDRVVADPFTPTVSLVTGLRLRASALRAHQRTPSVATRLRAGLKIAVAR